MVITETRTEVNVFRFELDEKDKHLGLKLYLTEEERQYLYDKYCLDKNGDYKNVFDSYVEEARLASTRT